MKNFEALYRILVRGLDEGTRRRYREEMLGAFSAVLAEARTRGVAPWIWTAARMLADAARCVARDRAADLRHRSRVARGGRRRRGLAPERELASAVRRARLTPVQSGAIVASVALSVGGATGLFAVADALLLRPLPVRDPGSLVALMAGPEDAARSYWTYSIWRALEQSEALDVAACARDEVEIRQPSRGRVSVLWVTGGFFDLLGVTPRVGRLVGRDDARSAMPVAVLGHHYWQTRFAGDPQVVGRSLVMGGTPLTVVGVAPEGFVGVEVDHRFDVAVPFETEPQIRGEESTLGGWGVRILGRLDPGDSLAAASARLRAVQPRIRDATVNPEWVPEYREEYLSEPMAFRPAASGLSSLGRRYGAVLWVLLATLALLVALAATNTASLLAARVVRRRVELGVRAALGATPVRIALPIVLESLVLTGSGAVLGHGVSALCSRLLLASLGATPDAIERASPLELRVVAFAIGLLLLVAVASALVPALKAARIDPLAAMRTATPLGRRGLAGRLLVANQVSLSLALLIVAGLAIQTFLDLAQRPIGFEGRGLLVARIRADERAGSGPGFSARDLGRRAREAVADLPELEAAGVSSITPLSLMAEMASWFCDAGDREPATDWVHRNFVSPGWFATYRTRVVAGRSFSDADVLGAPGVAIVNQAFAEAYPCGGPVLGAVIHERTYPDLAPGPPLTVVGIVEDAVYRSYRETAPPALYRPFAQMADPEGLAQPLSLTARPRAPDATSIRKLETTLRALSPAISVEVEPFDRRLDRALLKERLLADLSLAIGLLGGLLAVLGAYAVAALDASGRRREAAIRLALGASDLSIHATQLRRVAVALAIGLACGEALGYALSRIAHSWLGTAAPASTWVYAGAAALLGFATLTAVAVAARGALRMAPSRLLAVADQ